MLTTGGIKETSRMTLFAFQKQQDTKQTSTTGEKEWKPSWEPQWVQWRPQEEEEKGRASSGTKKSLSVKNRQQKNSTPSCCLAAVRFFYFKIGSRQWSGFKKPAEQHLHMAPNVNRIHLLCFKKNKSMEHGLWAGGRINDLWMKIKRMWMAGRGSLDPNKGHKEDRGSQEVPTETLPKAGMVLSGPFHRGSISWQSFP